MSERIVTMLSADTIAARVRELGRDSSVVTLAYSLHDPDGYARQSLDATATPAAVLLGADGLLAGGPVVGSEQIEGFVTDVLEVLHSGDLA